MKKKPEDKMRSIMILAIALLLILSLFLLIREDKECPLQKSCPVCEKTECPVFECSNLDCPACPAADSCPECEPCKEETRYICSDNRVVMSPDLCMVKQEIIFDPVKTNEDDTLIEVVTVEPACIFGRNGAKLYFKVGSIATGISYQIKSSPDDDWTTIHNEQNKFENHGSIFFRRPSDTFIRGDFSVPEGGIYLFRIEFIFGAFGTTSYSNEHIIDAREDGSYMQFRCS